MKYDIYQADALIYSTDANAASLQSQLREGERVALYESDERLTGQQWAELVSADVSAVATPARAITCWAFRKRFSHAERVGLELAALDDPSAAPAARQAAAAVRVYLADAAAARWIDLDDEDTRAGAQALETMGLLAEGRAVEILDAPVEPAETVPA